jgi:signal transduction histidine kinase
MFYTVLKRWRNTEAQLRQSEKMAQLGTLTAGVAHELNNPAAAVKRGAEQLQTAMTQLEETLVQINNLDLNEAQRETWVRLTQRAQEQAAHPPVMDALARSDREYELETRLEDRGMEDCWALAPTLVDMNLEDQEFDLLVDEFETTQLATIIRWLSATYTVYNLFAELRQGAERISGIVKALKTYSYLDQAPVQAVDVNKGLDDTLLILNHKLKGNINVQRNYADLPEVFGYGSELNQVWTNIIDNAADAVIENSNGGGLIALRTRQDGDWVIVEIEDNGPGIPADIQERVFEPFFTTKPPGVGTGLGLDISYSIVVHKHRGDIKIESEPGRTVFQVWLPVNFEESTVAPQ